MSRYADTSASGVTRRAAQKAVAAFYKANPVSAATGSLDVSTLIQRLQGLQPILQGPTGAVVSEGCCCAGCETLFTAFFPILIEDVGDFPLPLGYDLSYCFVGFVETTCTPDSVSGTILYNGQPVTTIVAETVTNPGEGTYFTIFLMFPISDSLPQDLEGLFENIDISFDCTITITTCGKTQTEDAQFGCFLKGTPVAMADGSTKPIEEVAVGDVVIGAFGEHNPVLALHRPILGASKVADINGEHKTTTHHPHIGAEKGFHCVAPALLTALTYGKKHTVTLADGTREKRVMPGVSKDRITGLTVGTVLQTLTGPREVDTIDYIPMSPLTKVYHLVVGGSHTYTVDGYAVTGWASEIDFDYDTWTPRN